MVVESRLAVLTLRAVHRSRVADPPARGSGHCGGVNPLRALDEAGGAARLTALRRAGVADRALRRAVAREQVLTVGHGTFALPGVPREMVLATLFRAQVGCISACEHWDLPLWGNHHGAHLVVPRHRSNSRRDPRELAAVTLHRTSAPLRSGPWTPVDSAVDQAAWCTSPLEQLVLIDAALRRGLMMRSDVAHFSQGTARRRAWLWRMSSGAAESPLETVARVGLVTGGLAVQEQVVVRGVGRVDLVVEEALVVEADGWEFHRDREAFERDRIRDRDLLLDGLPTMRFTARQLRADLPGAVRDVARAVGREVRRDFDRRLAWTLAPPQRKPGSRVA